MISWLAQRHWSLRLAAAGGFGALTALGFQPFGWWGLALLGVAGLSWCVKASPRLRFSVSLGLGYGLGLLLVGISWMQAIFFEAMVGLVVVEALFYALLGGLLHLALLSRWWPLLAAASWTIIEFVFSRFPFGGFGWMRLGYAMVDSPLAWGLPVFGVAGVGFLAAIFGQLPIWLAQRASAFRTLLALAVVVTLIAGAASGLLVRPGQASGEINVGWVQGGAPGGGVYGLGPARTITANQYAETVRLADRIDSGQLPKPAFIVWPENSTDLDPFTDAQTGQLVQAALTRAGVPILVGSVLDGPGTDERQTASLWWDPQAGVQQRYVKRGIVPFGEWVPFRSLLLPLIPVLAYVGPQSVAGTEPGVLTLPLAGREPVRLGVIVCYDLAFDQIVGETITNGAQAIVVQSSNAMYQGTGQIDQQFAITRARAMELRREILVVTTSGVSGLIRPDGSVAWRTTDHHSASGVVALPLRSGTTFTAGFAGLVELGLVALGLVGLTATVLYGRMAKSKTESGAKHG